jgi:hypothetical protein
VGVGSKSASIERNGNIMLFEIRASAGSYHGSLIWRMEVPVILSAGSTLETMSFPLTNTLIFRPIAYISI